MEKSSEYPLCRQDLFAYVMQTDNSRPIDLIKMTQNGVPKYSVAEMSVRVSLRHTGNLLAGIQEAFVDSGWKIAGMTIQGNGHFILLSCTKRLWSVPVSGPQLSYAALTRQIVHAISSWFPQPDQSFN